MRTILICIVVFLAAIVALYFLGPREPQDHSITFDPSTIGKDVDVYLSNEESKFPDIVDGAQKQIIWRNPETKQKTQYSIVYIHGFSATKQEIRPVPDIVAEELDANIFYTRLKGHGRKDKSGFGAAMAEASANDWLNDTVEAIEIGRRIGDRVIIIATSTGATFATWAAVQPHLMKDVEGMVLISANYGIQRPGASLLTGPWGEQIAKLIAGETAEFETSNEDHAKWWTSSYPIKAALPMAASIEMALGIPHKEIEIPTLFIYSPNDKVIDIEKVKEVARSWGGAVENPADTLEIIDSDDPNSHVIAGDILSPSTTDHIAGDIVGWISSLR